MSNLNDYNSKVSTLNAIEKKDIKIPNSIPVDIFLQEAENLYLWCQKDREKLNKSGVEDKLIDDLPVRCGALREAQSRWITARFTRKGALKKWHEHSEAAYDLRNELLHHFRFAYRENQNLLRRISAIAHNGGHAGLLQALNDLAVLAGKYPEQLTAIGLDTILIDKAAALSSELSPLLAAAVAGKEDDNELKNMRDRAYTHLKQAVDTIRKHGQYHFRRDNERRKGYVSQYWRKMNKR